jgi:DNA sulfur modification protein DndD
MSRLEILSLKIKDYRQYAGEETIDLQTHGEKNVNIIEGQNGAGKSNLLNAITLCLYGKETHRPDEDDNELESYPYVNRQKLTSIGENETAEGSIEITLGRGEPEYIFSRDFKTVKLPGGDFSSQRGDLQLKQKIGQDWKSVNQPATRLNQILPANVHEYFLFDGERLDEFFGKGYQERVKKGLLDVSHIELLDRGIDHLETIESDTQHDITDVGGEAKQKKKELNNAEDEVSETEEELENTKQEITDTENLIAEIDRKLKDSSDPDIREKQQRREHLQNQLDAKQDDIERLYGEASEALITAGTPLYAKNSLSDTEERLNELSERGELPPKIQDWFVEELLERGTCICGEDLTSDHENHLRDLRNDMSEVAEENMEGKIKIPSIIEDAEAEAETLFDKRKQLSEAEQEEIRLNKELKEISEELKTYDLPDDVDVQELERQREEYSDRLAKLREKKGRLELELEEAKEKHEQKKKEYNEAASQKTENAELLERISFAETARGELEDIKKEILNSVREEIEDKMDEYFNEIIWKADEHNVVLTEEYEVRVEGSEGDNKIGSLSAGERQVLAFSFLAALTSVSGFDAPILIDTPLGRISSDPKEDLAQNLPKYINETQITFLMTDEEYTDNVRMKMKPNVSNEYKLSYKDEVTEVVSYE